MTKKNDFATRVADNDARIIELGQQKTLELIAEGKVSMSALTGALKESTQRALSTGALLVDAKEEKVVIEVVNFGAREAEEAETNGEAALAEDATAVPINENTVILPTTKKWTSRDKKRRRK